MSALIQDAVMRSEQAEVADQALRLQALDQLFSVRFNVSGHDLKEIMEEDPFDQ